MRKKGYSNYLSPRYLEYKTTLKKLLSTPSIDETINIKINYLRYTLSARPKAWRSKGIKKKKYADDFIIGISGPKSLAELIYNNIDAYLKEILRGLA